MGKILRVDLSEGSVIDEELGEDLLRDFMGGAGVGANILYRETPQGIDSYHPENRLIFSTGPLTGTSAPGTGGYSLTCKGPLVNGFSVSSQAQGHFGARLRFAGYDHIIVQGASDKWCYLVVRDGKAEIRDAGHLVGKDAFDTEAQLKAELQMPRASVATIGPSGENQIDIAAIQSDRGHFVGNGGAGAVMGAKKLKAIAVSGTAKVPVKEPDRLRDLARHWADMSKTKGLGPVVDKAGTAGWQDSIYEQGWLPIKNLTTGVFPEYANFRGEMIRSNESFELKRDPCHACPLKHCHSLKIVSGPHAGFEGAEPEYEDLAQWSSNVGNTDLAWAIVLTDLNDRLGMNVNAAGFAISLAMECYEKGIISKKDADGLDLTWGNVEAIRELLLKMANREGFGAVLCDGPMKAAQRIGGEAPKLAVHFGKGNAPHAHDPRGVWGILLSQTVGDTASVQGGVTAPLWEPETLCKAERDSALRSQFLDCLVICHFTAGGLKVVSEGLSAVTGRELTPGDCLLVGERTMNLYRLFNVREGLTPGLDTVSSRLMEAPVDGPNKGRALAPHLDQIVRGYYREMGWDEDTGKPLPETLARLGIEQ